MSNITLNGVQGTLFIPLVSRKYVSEAFPEYFHDAKAIEIANKLPSNQIQDKSTEYQLIASASRCVVMDDITAKFIAKHEKSNVVCIGCGLETMAWRLSAYQDATHFYEVDFASVIDQRKCILGQLTHETLIAGDANTINLNQYMDCTLPTLFVVAGVFQYFKPDAIVQLLLKLQGEFANAEMIFDATSRTGLKIASRYVKKTGNADAEMYFAVDNGQDFAKTSGTKLMSQQSMYCKMTKDFRKKLKLYTNISVTVSNKFNMAMIYHVSL